MCGDCHTKGSHVSLCLWPIMYWPHYIHASTISLIQPNHRQPFFLVPLTSLLHLMLTLRCLSILFMFSLSFTSLHLIQSLLNILHPSFLHAQTTTTLPSLLDQPSLLQNQFFWTLSFSTQSIHVIPHIPQTPNLHYVYSISTLLLLNSMFKLYTVLPVQVYTAFSMHLFQASSN